MVEIGLLSISHATSVRRGVVTAGTKTLNDWPNSSVGFGAVQPGNDDPTCCSGRNIHLYRLQELTFFGPPRGSLMRMEVPPADPADPGLVSVPISPNRSQGIVLCQQRATSFLKVLVVSWLHRWYRM